MKETHLIIFIVFICLLFLFACRSNDGGEEKPVEEGSPVPGSAIAMSYDTLQLGKILNLQIFKPDSVLYQLSGIDIDSIEQDLQQGKDFKLEAVLFYEEHTYGKKKKKYMDEDFPKGDYKKEDFEFAWLDDYLKAELGVSKADYKGNPDIFLGTDGKAKLWFLDKKVLVKLDD